MSVLRSRGRVEERTDRADAPEQGTEPDREQGEQPRLADVALDRLPVAALLRTLGEDGEDDAGHAERGAHAHRGEDRPPQPTARRGRVDRDTATGRCWICHARTP